MINADVLSVIRRWRHRDKVNRRQAREGPLEEKV